MDNIPVNIVMIQIMQISFFVVLLIVQVLSAIKNWFYIEK